MLALRRRPERSQGDEFVDRTYSFDRLLEMLPECDYVVAAAPLTPQTRHMIGDAAFSAMKKTAVVMNVGRGPVIDEEALIRALESGRIRGAALDVFETEPLPAGEPAVQARKCFALAALRRPHGRLAGSGDALLYRELRPLCRR